MLGGHHTGNWDADFTATPPKYFGSGSVSKLIMAQVAALMHDPWATGTLDGQYTVGMTGLDAAALRESAAGSATFNGPVAPCATSCWKGQALRYHSPASAGRSHCETAASVARSASCNPLALTYDVNGSASFGRTLDIRLESTGPGGSYAISGPLDKPHVESVQSPQSEAKVR